MIFNNDRTQFVEKEGMHYMFEFLKVENIQSIQQAMESEEQFFHELHEQLSFFDQRKLNFIQKIPHDMFKLIIVHQEDVNMYLLWMKCQKNGHEKVLLHTYDFKGMQELFQGINNKDGQHRTGSKELGAAKTKDEKNQSNEDPFVNYVLGEIHGIRDFHDDNGLGLTMKLLNGYKTTGFDFDLYQYIPSTNEFIFYEFLKRKTPNVNNITAHPTRYTWMSDKAKQQNKAKGRYVPDNQRKFISLWRAKNFFKGRFYLVSYSDNPNEAISVMEILQLDEEKGIQEEKKYCMTQDMFIEWLKNMNQYHTTDTDYLRGYEMIHYQEQFFEDFRNRGKSYYEYGRPFLNQLYKRSV